MGLDPMSFTEGDLYPEIIEVRPSRKDQVPRRSEIRQYRDAGAGRERSSDRPALEPIRNLLPSQGEGNPGSRGGGQGPPNPNQGNAFSGYYGPTRTQDAFNANILRNSTPDNSLYEDNSAVGNHRGIASLLTHIVKPVKLLTSKIDR